MPSFNEEVMRPTEHFLWQLCKTYAREFPDPKRPVASELVAAFMPRVVRLLLLGYLAPDILRIARPAAEAIPDRSAEIMSESGNTLHRYSRELIGEIVELDSWLHEPGIDEAGCGDWLVEHGYGYQQVKEVLTRAKTYQAGRRPSKRLSTVAALEAKTLNKNCTWRKLVEEFCDCENTRGHNKWCMEALRKSVAHLKLTLEKYRTLPIPAEPLAPLADLFLRQLGSRRSE